MSGQSSFFHKSLVNGPLQKFSRTFGYLRNLQLLKYLLPVQPCGEVILLVLHCGLCFLHRMQAPTSRQGADFRALGEWPGKKLTIISESLMQPADPGINDTIVRKCKQERA